MKTCVYGIVQEFIHSQDGYKSKQPAKVKKGPAC
jgi:hypothetical protein